MSLLKEKTKWDVKPVPLSNYNLFPGFLYQSERGINFKQSLQLYQTGTIKTSSTPWTS